MTSWIERINGQTTSRTDTNLEDIQELPMSWAACQFQDAMGAGHSGTPTPTRAEIEAGEDALLRTPADERGGQLNPESGVPYTENEVQIAVDNAIDRRVAQTDFYFPVLDNPNSGTDGSIKINEDVKELAEGGYDNELVRGRLLEMGVPESGLDAAVAEVEQLARDIRDIPELRNRLDSANASDNSTDSNIRRGDVDALMIDITAETPPEPRSAPTLTPAEQNEAQALATRWSDPAKLGRDLNNTDLEDMSDVERLVLAKLAQSDNSDFDATVRNYVADSVRRANSLNDVPTDIGMQVLVGRYVASPGVEPSSTGNQVTAREHLVELIDEEINATIDARLDDRRGDSEADLTLTRLEHDIAGVIAEQPASASLIQLSVNRAGQERGGDITDVRRADANILQDTNHLVTGVGGSALGFTGDVIRFTGDAAGTMLMTPIRVSGEVTDFGLYVTGSVLGGGLDLVGADGAADGVRETFDDAGNVINSTSDVVGEFGEAAVTVISEAPAAVVDWDFDANRVNEAIGTVEIEAGQATVDAEDLVGNEPTVVGVEELLSPEQRERVEAIFGEGINYDDVEIVIDGADIIMKISEGRPLAGGNQIVFSNEGVDPANPSLDDKQFAVFVHELGHVWQSQSGGNGYIVEAQIAQELGEGYNIGRAVDRIDASDGRLPLFSELNPEQQAEIFLVAHESGYLDSPDQLILIRTKNPDNSNGLGGESFEIVVVDRNDSVVVEQQLDEGWTDMTPLIEDALSTAKG